MEDVSVLSLVGRLVFSLAVVLVLMALVARVFRNRAVPGIGRLGPRRDVLGVVARQPLSRTTSVAVIRAGERALLVGVSDQGVELLAELEPDVLEPPDDVTGPANPTVSWGGVLDALRERTVRRT